MRSITDGGIVALGAGWGSIFLGLDGGGEGEGGREMGIMSGVRGFWKSESEMSEMRLRFLLSFFFFPPCHFFLAVSAI